MPRAAKSAPSASSPTTHFRKEGIVFLKNLVKANAGDPVAAREWFNANKAVYEAELKEPMLAIIRHITDAMMDFAPEHVRPAEKSLFRIYRDTRFSNDKRPYKDHVAAWWTHTGLDKTSGAGYYFHVSTKEVIIAAGAYMPEKDQLAAIRHWLLDHHAEFRKQLQKPAVRKAFREFEGNALTRPPKGFPADHPAIDLIQARQWGLSTTLPAEMAVKPDLTKEIVRHFKLAAPIVAALNTPIAASLEERSQPRKTVLFGLPQGPKSAKNR
jgi:uncharacterized protein (TIGR02453 family)